jgi:hypothetical protein
MTRVFLSELEMKVEPAVIYGSMQTYTLPKDRGLFLRLENNAPRFNSHVVHVFAIKALHFRPASGNEKEKLPLF